MMKDIHNNLEFRRLLSPVSSADDTPLVSEIIDTAGFGGLELVIATGSIGDANATFTALVEDGNAANLSDNAAVDDAYLLGIEGVAATPTGLSFRYDSDNKTFKIGYIGPKRYVRLTITPSGNSGTPSAALLSAIAVLGHARVGPKSSQAV